MRTSRPPDAPTGGVEFVHVGLRRHAEPFDLKLGPGTRWAVMGPNPEDLRVLLETASGTVRPAVGSVRAGPAAWADVGRSPRQTLQAWSKRLAGPNSETRVAEALLACGLWDHRRTLLQHLPAQDLARVGLLRPLLGDSPVLLLHGAFDPLDPWILPGVVEAFERRCAEGATLLAATVRADVAVKLGSVIVLHSGSLAFQGSTDSLRDSVGPVAIDVSTPDRDTARSIVAPMAIEVRDTEEGLWVRAEDGQALAARLLLEGYGSVQAVVVRRPSVEEALHSVTARAAGRPHGARRVADS